jgi:exodeoxyribonuclease-3
MKFCSWNVNGIRAVAKKGFFEWLNSSGFDLVGLQEIKASDDQLGPDFNSLFYPDVIFNPAQRKGYSGVAVYAKSQIGATKPAKGFLTERFKSLPKITEIISLTETKKETLINQTQSMSRERLLSLIDQFNAEGRIIETQIPFGDSKIIFLNIYFPNGGANSERLIFKLNFYEVFLAYLDLLLEETPNVIITGDYNTAHHNCDLARPDENLNTSGFMPIEREYLDRLEKKGFVDSFRFVNPEKKDAYTWWSFRTAARKRNVGWRIDYFFVSDKLKSKIQSAQIHNDIEGSDHCPISIEIKPD